MTGKILTPIVQQADGTYSADLLDQTHRIQPDKVEEFKKLVRKRCYIPYVCDLKQFEALRNASQDEIGKIFADLECKTLQDWLDLIQRNFPKTSES